MRDSGRASRAAMESVIKDLSDYEDIIIEELDRIISEIRDLSDIWDDENYQSFLVSVENIKFNIETELNTVRHTRYALEEKVKIYDRR